MSGFVFTLPLVYISKCRNGARQRPTKSPKGPAMNTMICPVDTTAGPMELLNDIADIVTEVFGPGAEGMTLTPQGRFGGAWQIVDHEGYGGPMYVLIDPATPADDETARYNHLLIDQLVDLMTAYAAATDDHVTRHRSGGLDIRL